LRDDAAQALGSDPAHVLRAYLEAGVANLALQSFGFSISFRSAIRAARSFWSSRQSVKQAAPSTSASGPDAMSDSNTGCHCTHYSSWANVRPLFATHNPGHGRLNNSESRRQLLLSDAAEREAGADVAYVLLRQLGAVMAFSRMRAILNAPTFAIHVRYVLGLAPLEQMPTVAAGLVVTGVQRARLWPMPMSQEEGYTVG
jgi:hypothetical protein